MNRMKYIIQILMVVLLFGCTDEEIFKTKGDIEVVAGFANTRTTFVEDDGVTHVTWNIGDAIGMFTQRQNNLQYTALNDGNETKFSALEEMITAEEGDEVYAYYPYSHNTQDSQKVKLPNIENQFYSETPRDFIYASGKVTNRKVSLQFKHLFAFLKITIPINILNAKNNERTGLQIKSSENIAFQDLSNEGTVYFDMNKEEIVSENLSDMIYYYISSSLLENKQEIICYVAILPQTEKAELKISTWDGDPLIMKNAPAGGFKAGNVYTLYLNGDEVENMQAKEREALIALYKATNGDNWINNTNWCSDKPISEWYGVGLDEGEFKRIGSLFLYNNNLSGVIPDEIGNLECLESLHFDGNNLAGSIPESIGNLKKLKKLFLSNNKLEGSIPNNIGNLINLERMDLDGNNLSGTIPESIGNLKNLKYLDLIHNKLSSIPGNIGMLEKLERLDLGSNLLSGNIPTSMCELKNVTYLSLEFNQLTGNLPENIGNLTKLSYFSVSNNQLTGTLPESIGNLTNLTEIYLSVNQFTGNLPESMKNLRQLSRLEATRCNFEGQIPEWIEDASSLQTLNLAFNRFSGPVSMEIWNKWGGSISAQQPGYIVSPEDYYVSTDFSKDGEITVMQTHSKGSGIKLVLMGDLFVDKDMEEGGKYETLMNLAMENYFSIEPVKSLREYFDVIAIKAVSENDWASGKTAFETLSKEGIVSYNEDKCKEYALKATGCSDLNNTHIILVNLYAGAQTITEFGHLFDNSFYQFSLTCCRYNKEDPNYFEDLIHQSAIGYGLGLLHNEFYIPSLGSSSPTSSDIETINSDYMEFGRYANIDFTDDLSKLRWARFINDTRYKNEGIGAYEGASWVYGAYRPTEYSIMREGIWENGKTHYVVNQFNAPSREAIYKNIMRMAYGDSWAYDFEEFVKFDEPGRADWMEAINNINTRSVQSTSRAKQCTRISHLKSLIIQ